MSVVCALHISAGPEIETLKQALLQLQSRHPLLRSGIVKRKGALCFQQLSPVPPIKLKIIARTNEDSWRSATEDALNTTYHPTGPLMKCLYLPNDRQATCELIVCFHHAIIDGISARLLLHELLSLAGKLSLPEQPESVIDPVFPPEYRNWNLVKQLPRFLFRQMKDEWKYNRVGVKAPIPKDATNSILSFRLPPLVSRKLTARIGRAGLSLNSVLLALIVQKVHQHRHPNSAGHLVRVISFADLRPAMQPLVSKNELGCYVSMLRFSIPITSNQSVFSTAVNIRKGIFQASRQGDVFMMSKMSKYVMRMVLKLKNTRLGVAALSFIGKLDLESQYGVIQLHNVNAFISNNPLGAEFSAFGKILFGSIVVDFNYLKAEIGSRQAEQIVQEIKEELEAMANISVS